MLVDGLYARSVNHGRNSAIFRYRGRFELAPIYDLAPMVLDPQGVILATKWNPEHMGRSGFREICAHFQEVVRPDVIFERLLGAAEAFRALPDLLIDVPEEVRRAQSIPMNNLDCSLVAWGLR